MRHSVALALLVLTILGPVASVDAQNDQRRPIQQRFRQLDSDQNGKLSSDEVAGWIEFGEIDVDANGEVTLDEFRTFARANRTQNRPAQSAAAATAPDPVIFPVEQQMEAKRQLIAEIKPVARAGNRPPNIVLLLADDLGYADTAIYGSKTIPTPHIDALASGGVRFTNAYVTAGTCSPSRAGIMSGRYQQRFGFEFNTSSGAITQRESRGLDPAVVTMADVFKQAGYATGMFGKWHLGTREYFHPHARGFDDFFGFLAGAHSYFPATQKQPRFATLMRGNEPLIEPEYLTDAFARETVRFIHEHRDEPFFAYVPFNAVHTPIEATDKYLQRFPDVEDLTQRTFNAMTSALDDAVGSIMAALKQDALLDNTLVIFLDDNGGPMYTGVQNNGPLRMGKLFLFEGGIRVPMIMQLPGRLQAGAVYEQPTSSMDVFPSACAVAGIPLPSALELDGVDLLPFLDGKNDSTPHKSLFWSNGPNTAVRIGPWKLITSGESKWLFNLDDDIGELKNLVSEKPDVVERLEDAYKHWRSEMKDPAWPSKPNRRKVMIDGMSYEINV